MPVTYCSSCGHKMMYTLDKPKFCSECGQSLGTLTSTVKPLPPETNENIDPEGSDVYEVPDIKDFQYEVELDKDTSFTFGSLFSNPPPEVPPPKPKRKRGRPRKKK